MRVEHVKAAVTLWKRRAAVAHRRAQAPSRHWISSSAFTTTRGSWTDGGGPYYGGLQMEIWFHAAYGRSLLRTKGTADHWALLKNIWLEEKVGESRRFYPWPNTTRSSLWTDLTTDLAVSP